MRTVLQEASRRVASSSAGDRVAIRLQPPPPSLPVAMDEDHGPTSFSISLYHAPALPIFVDGLSSPCRRRPLPPLPAPLLFVAHRERRRGSDGIKACNPAVKIALDPRQSRGRLCRIAAR
ncbi:hypothetical protein D1007_11714 [Hordeum vulgare]|nr:hypothetical protein D1007_11714 [Hordeum vulgare]